MKDQELKISQMDHGPGAPRYAIVRLAPKDDVFNLFRLLVHNGYHEVSFVNGLKDTVLPWPLANVIKSENNSQENGHGSVDSLDSSLKIGGSPPADSNSDSEAGGNPINTHEHEGFGPNPSSASTLAPEISVSTTAPFPPLLLSPSTQGGFPPFSSSSVIPPASGPPPITSLVPAFPPPTLAIPNFFGHGHRGLHIQSSVTREVITPPYSVPNPTIVPTTNCGIPFFQKFPTIPHPPPLQVTVPGQVTSASAMIPTSLQSSGPGTAMIPLTTPATTQLRQRGSRAQSDDPSVYVACRLCNNKIMASRLSNLTNHVRRHSTLKQFQCCYCDYTHNEMAKVRLHMLHNHKDKDSQPIDNLSPEMQTSWDVLMQQCFPDHYQGGQANNQTGGRGARVSCPEIKPLGSPDSGRIKTEYPPCPEIPMSTLQRSDAPLLEGDMGGNHPAIIRPCFECGEMVIPVDRLEHIRQSHMECYPYVCSLCGYDHPDQGKVLLHINLKHGNNTSAQVFTRDITIVAEALIPKYFPEGHTSPIEGGTPVHTPTDTASRRSSDPVSFRETSEGNQAEGSVLTRPPEPEDVVESLGSRMDAQGIQMSMEGEHFSPGIEDLRCQLCRKILDGVRPLSSLLNHAKRHYHVKQFQCTECPYSSSEAAHVRSHIKLKHHLRGKIPLDNRTGTLEQAWMQTMAKCFPAVTPRLKKFRFKNFRSKPPSRPKTEETREVEPVKKMERGSSEPGEDNRGSTMEYSESDEAHSGAENKSDSPIYGTQPETFQSSDLPLNKRQCRLCDRWVTTEDLFLHATTHITLKPFGCSVCPFRTNDYQHLRAHLWKHKLIAGGERHKARIAANTADINSIRHEYVSYCFGQP